MDFINHKWSQARSGIGRAKAVGALGGILGFAGADDVAAEGDTVLSGTEWEAITVSGQVALGIAGREVNFLPVRIESEMISGEWIGIPIVLSENFVATGRN